MKVKELINHLKTYDPEYEMMITLPPGWYSEEDAKNKEIWNKGGWTHDSIDYTLIFDESKFISVCPIVPPKEMEKCVLS